MTEERERQRENSCEVCAGGICVHLCVCIHSSALYGSAPPPSLLCCGERGAKEATCRRATADHMRPRLASLLFRADAEQAQQSAPMPGPNCHCNKRPLRRSDKDERGGDSQEKRRDGKRAFFPPLFPFFSPLPLFFSLLSLPTLRPQRTRVWSAPAQTRHSHDLITLSTLLETSLFFVDGAGCARPCRGLPPFIKRRLRHRHGLFSQHTLALPACPPSRR